MPSVAVQLAEPDRGFAAFLSYSSSDHAFVRRVHRDLETFAGRWWRPRASRIFIDRQNLAADAKLWPTLERYLQQSRYLVVAASPAACQNLNVDKEIELFLQSPGARDRVIIALLDGRNPWARSRVADAAAEPTAVPSRLVAAFGDHAPHVVDFCPFRRKSKLALWLSLDRDGRRDTWHEYLSALASIAAPLQGREKDEVFSTHAALARRRRLVGAVAAVLILGLAATLGVTWMQRRWQQSLRLQSEAQILADQGKVEEGTERLAQAHGLATDAVPLHEVVASRWRAGAVLWATAAAFPGLTAVGPNPSQQHDHHLVPWGDGRTVLGSTGRGLGVWSVVDGSLTTEFAAGDEERVSGFAVGTNRDQVAAIVARPGSSAIRIWDVRTGLARMVEGCAALHIVAGLDGDFVAWDYRRVHRIDAVNAQVAWTWASKRGLDKLWPIVRQGGAVRLLQELTATDLRWTDGEPLGEYRRQRIRTPVAQAIHSGRELLAQAVRAESGGPWKVQLRSLANAEAPLLHELDCPSVACMGFEASGEQLLVATRKWTIEAYDVTSGEHLHTTPAPAAPAAMQLVPLPDGELLVAGTVFPFLHPEGSARGRLSAAIIRRDTGKATRTWAGHGASVQRVALSEDGRHVASSDLSGTVHLWDSAEGKHLHAFVTSSAVTDLTFDPSGSRLAAATLSGTTTIWDVLSRQERCTIRGGGGVLCFHPRGDRVAAWDDKRSVRVWSAQTGEQLDQPPLNTGVPTQLSWSPDGSLLAVVSVSGVAAWDVKRSIRLWSLEPPPSDLDLPSSRQRALRVTFAGDSQHIVAVFADGALRLLDACTGAVLLEQTRHVGPVVDVSCSANGRFAATIEAEQWYLLSPQATGANRLVLHDLAEPSNTRSLEIPGLVPSAVCLGADARFAIVGDHAGRVMVVATDSLHEGRPESWSTLELGMPLTASSDGVVSVADDGQRFRAIETSSGRTIADLDQREGALPGDAWAAFTPDRQRLALLHTSNLGAVSRLSVWDAVRWHRLRQLDLEPPLYGEMRWLGSTDDLAFYDSRELVVISTLDGRLRARMYAPHESRWCCVADDASIVVALGTTVLTVVAVPDGRETKSIALPGTPPFAVALDPRRNTLCATRSDGTAFVTTAKGTDGWRRLASMVEGAWLAPDGSFAVLQDANGLLRTRDATGAEWAWLVGAPAHASELEWFAGSELLRARTLEGASVSWDLGLVRVAQDATKNLAFDTGAWAAAVRAGSDLRRVPRAAELVSPEAPRAALDRPSSPEAIVLGAAFARQRERQVSRYAAFRSGTEDDAHAHAAWFDSQVTQPEPSARDRLVSRLRQVSADHARPPDWAQVRAANERLLELRPGDPAAQVHLSEACLGQGQWQQALDTAMATLGADRADLPYEVHALALRVCVHAKQQLGSPLDALEELEALASLPFVVSDGERVELCRCLFELGRYAEVVEVAQRALQPAATTVLALERTHLERWHRSAEVAFKLLETAPQLPCVVIYDVPTAPHLDGLRAGDIVLADERSAPLGPEEQLASLQQEQHSSTRTLGYTKVWHLLRDGSVITARTHGAIADVWLGLLSPKLARTLEVVSADPQWRVAGAQPRDKVRSLDGVRVETMSQMREVLGTKSDEAPTQIEFLRYRRNDHGYLAYQRDAEGQLSVDEHRKLDVPTETIQVTMPASLVRVGLRPTTIREEDAVVAKTLEEAASQPQATRKLLLGNRYDDAAFRKYFAAESVTALTILDSSRISVEGLATLQRFRYLEQVSISGRFAGSSLRVLRTLPRLREIRLSGAFVNDDWLSALDGSAVEELTVDGDAVTLSGLASAALPNLRKLRVESRGIQDENLMPLAHLQGLESLDLRGTRITGVGLTAVQKLWGLRALCIRNAALSHLGLASLGQLQQIDRLDLAGTGVDDLGLAAVAKLVILRRLTLTSTEVSSEGLAILASLSNLETLALGGTKVTGAGCSHLTRLPHLHTLDLSDLDLSGHGLAELSGCPELEDLDLSRARLDNTATAELAALTHLTSLALSDAASADLDCGRLSQLRLLKSLKLDGVPLAPGSLDGLQPLADLTDLDLSRTGVSAADLAALAALPRLETLGLEDVTVDMAVAKSLCQIPALRYLALTDDRVAGDARTLLTEKGIGM